MTNVPFDDALSIWVNLYCRMRLNEQDPLTVGEMCAGLMTVIVSTLNSVPEETRVQLKDACHRCLEQGGGTVPQKSEMN